MFENAELGHALDKETYDRELPKLRADLLAAQHELAASDLSVVVVMAGVPAGGKSESINALLQWLDARGVLAHPLRGPTDEEAQRPALYRYWRDLPPSGRLAVFFGGWNDGAIAGRALGKVSQGQVDRAIDRYVSFERMLVQERTLLVKVWLHLTKKAMRRRLKKLRADPDTAWRVTKQDRKLLRHYGELRDAAEHLLRRTGIGEAPWTLVDAEDRRYRDFTVGQTLLTALREGLDARKAAPPRPAPQPLKLTPPAVNVINSLDMSLKLDDDQYEDELAHAQGELGRLTRRLRDEGRSLIVVFEGSDAAGKGGAIRRLTAAMDARDYQVISVAAPTDEERAHPYLWRFWRHLPLHGRATIYDRSWYGRVLVERVEGFATPEEWQRAYSEINDFEQQLTESGVVLVKFWLAISPEEQLRRFADRELTPYKQYKLTEEDWRNREKWDSYVAAACDVIEKTSTAEAPWTLVEAEDKKYARVKVVRTVVRRLKEALGD